VKDAEGLAVQGAQFVTEQTLVLPDGLEQFFGRRHFAFAQKADAAVLQAPPGVKTGRIGKHLALFFARFGR
jgi:hypothetical protein